MLPMGSWFIGTLIQDKEAGKFDFNWGVTTIPHPEGVEAGATVGSTTPVAIKYTCQIFGLVGYNAD